MNNEINYAARVPVWNGLGTDISACSNVNEALEKSGLDFEVRQTDVVTNDFYPITLKGYKANIKDDGTPLGIVTNKYKVVQNRDAFAFLDSLISDGMQFERAGGLQGGRKVFILAKMPEKYIISGECIDPYIIFINSHDGTGSIKILMTPVRMICLNMLNLALRSATRNWSAVHCGDIAGKLEDAKDTLLYANEYMHALGAEIEQLKSVHLADSKVIDLVHQLLPVSEDMTELQKRNLGQLHLDILSRYHNAPDLKIMKKSAYRFINAVADHANHFEGLRRRENSNENLFANCVQGHRLVDKAYSMLEVAS